MTRRLATGAFATTILSAALVASCSTDDGDASTPSEDGGAVAGDGDGDGDGDRPENGGGGMGDGDGDGAPGGASGDGDESVPLLQGYGTDSSFGTGEGSESCVVTRLDDAGPGTFRDCVANRNGEFTSPTPRHVTFSVSGTIILLTDLAIRQPYLTIDGLSAPEGGITIQKIGTGEEGEMVINTAPGQGTCGHDVLVQGLRFVGTWTRDTEEHSQNADNLSVDGEDLPGCLRNVVIFRNTYVNAQDTAGNYWGSVQDSTFAYNALLYSLHPVSISHAPGGEENQERQRLSIHHNLYAYIHERANNVRGNVLDSNFEQNIYHKWDAFGFGGGYATEFRCRGGGCPQRINMTHNHYTSGGVSLNAALEFADDADPAQIYSFQNRFPAEESDDGRAGAPFSRTDMVDLFAPEELVTHLLPLIGPPSRTSEEEEVFAEVAAQVALDQ